MNARMSAFGPKRTWLVAPRMSAFGGKADMAIAVRMSVYDQGDWTIAFDIFSDDN
jgi:hypothetical protein